LVGNGNRLRKGIISGKMPKFDKFIKDLERNEAKGK
jgi:hypothetical protein